MQLTAVAHGQHRYRCRGAGERCSFGVGERTVRAGGAPDRLCGVVDEDVERSLRRNRIRQRCHLCGIAEVDTDDAQAVQPLVGVRLPGESPGGVLGEPGGDGEVGTVAEQHQRDVHADLCPATGEKRAAAAQVGVLVAFVAVGGRASWAELMVERVDPGVVLLADVARLGADERSGGATGRARQR